MKKRAKKQPEVAGTSERLRRCLLCGEEFLSAWAGNRVCKRCKARSSWRSGL